MTEIPRIPYGHALHMVNETSEALNELTNGRSVPGEIAVGVLTARSNLAIASALLAVADAIRATAGSQP